MRAASEDLYHDTDSKVSDHGKTIIPHALLVQVFSKKNIARFFELNRLKSSEYPIGETVRRICGNGEPDQLGSFARIFALLLLCGKHEYIFDFFENGFDDTVFPFRVTAATKWSRSVCPRTREEGPITGWEDMTCEHFVTSQWRVNLPLFELGPNGMALHQDFEQEQIMPWYDCHLRNDSSSSTGGSGPATADSLAPGGGYSEVSKVIMHDGHHRFGAYSKTHPSSRSPAAFAVKKLKTLKSEDFDQEVKMLRNLGGKVPHTVKLLATFRHGRTFCLVFPWAECDLLEYWFRLPGPPPVDAVLARWVSEQCLGLVKALSWMHDPKGAVLDPKNHEPLFGRHGDIKPENILWFLDSAGPSHLDEGQLVISDFGLSALNHKDTRTGIDNKNIMNTRAYAPPESILPDDGISRAIDIWALGCVYLEFVTWLLGGHNLVAVFREARNSLFLSTKVKNDTFWELQHVEDSSGVRQPVRVVKPSVTNWIQTLHDKPRATSFVKEFLGVIQNSMLMIEKEQRKTSEELIPLFQSLNDKCNAANGAEYCTKPASLSSPRFIEPQFPVVRHLSDQVQEMVNKSETPLPRYTGAAVGGLLAPPSLLQLRI
ncbi:kinase-like domain-containing protein [Podospora appendiculata]|uniref:Kinase-like domain-containing protein n=1 Tax=Podospora appendiculata TaxID=314037 RepID=A0AAE0XC36_9PEZI|nr:kinase-like domain-containing protein [Podospora appendiculata]